MGSYLVGVLQSATSWATSLSKPLSLWVMVSLSGCVLPQGGPMVQMEPVTATISDVKPDVDIAGVKGDELATDSTTSQDSGGDATSTVTNTTTYGLSGKDIAQILAVLGGGGGGSLYLPLWIYPRSEETPPQGRSLCVRY